MGHLENYPYAHVPWDAVAGFRAPGSASPTFLRGLCCAGCTGLIGCE